MNFYLSKRPSWLENFRLLPGVQRIILFNKQDKTFKIRIIAFGLSLLVAFIMGGLLVNVPTLYLSFGIGGLVFAYLLLFKVEIAVIVYLLIQNHLTQYNYLGGGSAFHPNGLIGAALIGGAIYFFMFNQIDFSRLPVFKHFLGFLAICLVSVVFAGNYFMDSLTVTLKLGSGLAIYAILLYKLDSIKKVRWMILAIIASQLWPTIHGILTTRTNQANLGGGGLARLDTDGGGYLMQLLVLSLIHLLNTKKNSQRLLWGFPTAVFAAGLFLSYSRNGWIGFLIALVVIGLLKHIRLLTILPVLLIILIVLVPSISARFSDIDSNNLDDENSNTLAHRISLWKAAIQVYKTRPLFGVGYGIGEYRVAEYLAKRRWAMHNDYVMVLLNTGLIGFIAFMLWHGQWLVALFKVYRETKHEYDKMIALGVFGIFIALLVVRSADNILQATPTSYPLFALIAATLALPRIRAEEEARKSDTVSPGYVL